MLLRDALLRLPIERDLGEASVLSFDPSIDLCLLKLGLDTGLAVCLGSSELRLDPARGERSRLERRPPTSLPNRLGDDKELCLEGGGGGGGGGGKSMSSAASVKGASSCTVVRLRSLRDLFIRIRGDVALCFLVLDLDRERLDGVVPRFCSCDCDSTDDGFTDAELELCLELDGLRFRPRREPEWSLLCSTISSKALTRALDCGRLLRSSCVVRAMEIDRVRRRGS